MHSHGPEHKPSTAVVAGVVIGVIAGVGIGVGAYMNSKKRAAERMLQGDNKGTHILVDAAGDGETRNPILEIDAHNANRVKASHDVAIGSYESTASTTHMAGGSTTSSSTNLQHLELAPVPRDHPVIDDAKPWGQPVETPDLSPIKTPRVGDTGFEDWDVVDTIL